MPADKCGVWRVFLQGAFLKQLKKMLVRDGRSSRGDFVLGGVAPFLLAAFGMLCAPAFPVLGELGLVLIIAVIFTSRAILAAAIRRTHDLGVSDEYLKSMKHQTGAYLQAFIVLMVATTFQQLNGGNPVTAMLTAAIFAAVITCVMVGGQKVLWVLARTIGQLGPNEHGLPTEGPLQPVAQVIQSAPPRPRPAPSAPVPPREPRKHVAVPQGRPVATAPPMVTPTPHQPPRIRKRNKAIGDWS